MTLRTLNYGNYGIFLIMGHAGFCSSAELRNIRASGKPGGSSGLRSGFQLIELGERIKPKGFRVS